MLTYDQEYARQAYDHVMVIKEKNEQDRKRYGSMAHKLPILIYKAGLVQALAFVDARGNEVQKQLLTDLAGSMSMESREVLLKKAREVELSEYIYLTQQAFAALLWYKRFVQSILGIDASESNDVTAEEKV